MWSYLKTSLEANENSNNKFNKIFRSIANRNNHQKKNSKLEWYEIWPYIEYPKQSKLYVQSIIVLDNWLRKFRDKLYVPNAILSVIYKYNTTVTLNDFNINYLLGTGSFGQVFHITFHSKYSAGEPYALKVISKYNSMIRKQDFHTETERKVLELISTNKFPFLTHMIYAFQDDYYLYIVMNFFQGGELFFHLKKLRRFNESIVKFWAAQMVLILEFLHSYNIIWRSCKPEDILIDKNCYIIGTDFGLCKILNSKDDRTHTFCGTPEYISPEIVDGVSGHGLPTDWWSFGILVYELTVGIPPFYSENLLQMYENIRSAPLLLANVNPDLADLLRLLLDRNCQTRLGSKNDAKDIKVHRFFNGIDWDKLLNKQLESPYKPPIWGNNSLENFDHVFLDNAEAINNVLYHKGQQKLEQDIWVNSDWDYF